MGEDADKRIYTDAVSVFTGTGIGTAPFDGTLVYQDEDLEFTASSGLREFPGAYSIDTHVVNNGERVAFVVSKIVAINGNAVEPGSGIDCESRVILYPGIGTSVKDN